MTETTAPQPPDAKRLSQFFTPAPVARFMAAWVAGHPDLRQVLDPAVGRGALLEALLEQDAAPHVRALDLDPRMLQAAAQALDGRADVDWQRADYLYDDWDRRYDGILCNPPYRQFRDFDDRHAVLPYMRTRLAAPLSGFSNLYALFLLKSVYQLAPGGRAAYIVPSEFLNADYGVAVKRYLLDSDTLRHIAVFDAGLRVFPDALTTACILLLSRDRQSEDMTFFPIGAAADLEELSRRLQHGSRPLPEGRRYRRDELDPARKWRPYYQGTSLSHFKNLVPFSTFGKVVRGIATGANEFFTFDRAKQQRLGIPAKRLLPCVTRSAQAPTPFFTRGHFARLSRQGKKVYLLDPGPATEEAVRRYIAQGEQQGFHRRYLTRHRTPWYAPEHRAPAPLWLAAFNRGGLRCVRNEAAVRHLTTFHGAYLHTAGEEWADLVCAFFLTPTAQRLCAEQRREYGGGLEKFEPNDLNNAQIVDLGRIGAGDRRRILGLYGAYRASHLAGRPNDVCRQRLDAAFADFLD